MNYRKKLSKLYEESVAWFFDLDKEEKVLLFYEYNNDIIAIVCADFTLKAVESGHSPQSVLAYIRSEVYGL